MTDSNSQALFDLEAIEVKAQSLLESANSIESLDSLRVEYLGKKGAITKQLKGVASLDLQSRRVVGAKINKFKDEFESNLKSKLNKVKAELFAKQLATEQFDTTISAKKIGYGSFHPVSEILAEMTEIFEGLGFAIEEGSEIEDEYYNFKALNFPDNHPARDMADTFYIQDGARLLRTHTSPVQIHAMRRRRPPLAIIAPGRVFRRDSDTTHSPVFHQIEGFLVDRKVTMGDLVGVLELFVKKLYGPKRKIRLRGSFFPFTEPSVEVDVSCFSCKGQGCRVCKGSGWLEILGAGMIDPNVLTECSIDPEQFSGFAFGCGIERIAMLKYEIDDIRLLFENDPRFLAQFR
ncbi:MAG: phenylalanine--tRNA ligase subunit alpha [Nitrospinota bacterium]